MIKRVSLLEKTTSACSAVLGPHWTAWCYWGRQDDILAAFLENCRPTVWYLWRHPSCFLWAVYLKHTLHFRGKPMRARNAAHLVECLPGTHWALDSSLQRHTEPGVAVHACNLSTLEMEAGDQKSKVIFGSPWVRDQLGMCEALISRKRKYIDKSAYLISRLRPNKGLERVNW